MKTKTKTALGGIIALSVLMTTAVFCVATECADKGIVQGNSDCATASPCSNHLSQTTCQSGVIVIQFPNVGTVKGDYVNYRSKPCSIDVTCTWGPNGCGTAPGNGDAHDAQFPFGHHCD